MPASPRTAPANLDGTDGPTEQAAGAPIEHRVTADRDEPFVVFHVGMRINAFRKVHRWLPLLLLAPRMVSELDSDPDSGLLGSRAVVGPGVRHVGFVQYWDSFDALEAYADDRDRLHRPAWTDFYRERSGDAAVGIWHETYVVEPDSFETVYVDVPPHGLGDCDGVALVGAEGARERAAGRIGGLQG